MNSQGRGQLDAGIADGRPEREQEQEDRGLTGHLRAGEATTPRMADHAARWQGRRGCLEP